jgi:hypothetical protein
MHEMGRHKKKGRGENAVNAKSRFDNVTFCMRNGPYLTRDVNSKLQTQLFVTAESRV